MRFTSLTLRNFQAIDSIALADFGALNIFIGPKHSGKTSILESVYFQFHHQSLQDEQAYFTFLNRAHGTQEVFYSVETSIREGRSQYTVATGVQKGKAGDRVSIGPRTTTETEQRRVIDRLGERIKFIPSWERHSKDVYYGGPESAAAQRERFSIALKELSQNPLAWRAYSETLADFFPNLFLGKNPRQDILDFFGTGFFGTAKILLYLHDPRVDVLLVDEPEIYFYPSLARKLVRLMADLIRQGIQKQVFIATHSPIFLNQREITHFYHIQRDHDGHIRAARRDRDTLLRSLEYTGTRPESILTAEMILYVEGPSDIAVFEEFVQKFPELSHVHISFQQLGGGAVGNSNVDPLRLKENNLLSFVVLDSERRGKGDAGDKSHFAFRDRCYAAHVYCLVLDRRAIENYFTPRALRAAFGDRVPRAFVNRPYELLDRQLRWYDKEMNRQVAHAMTKQEILAYPDLRHLFSALVAAGKKFS